MLTDNKYLNAMSWFCIIVWILGLLCIWLTPVSCEGAEPERQQQELTVGDKAKIAAGTCLFGLFWSDPLPDDKDVSYMYPTDNAYTHDPIPNGVIKEKGD